ncbi:MAG: MarR family transcriptional regulator [Lachnospiraceae bacterium]|nr:MarR family transcriptional regulator [Lachnospiraceae bacterium]
MRQTVGYLMKQIIDKHKVSVDASFKSRNLTLSQARVLQYISDKGGRVAQKSIEEHLDVSHPTVVGIVSRMEKNGYLHCYTDEEDRRNKMVEMTERAVRLSHEMQNEVASYEEELLRGLTKEEIESLYRMLDIMYKNVNLSDAVYRKNMTSNKGDVIGNKSKGMV